jgi:hypothetical protein
MTPTGRKDRHPDDTYLQQAAENDARLQPDPELALSGGKASGMQKWAVALGSVLVVALVLYGLSQRPQESQTAATPSAPPAETTGAAPAQDQKAAPEQPAQEPAKPGPANSAR